MTNTLILLRHGQSEWNEKNLFTGWVDVRLTEKVAAKLRTLASCSLKPACYPTCCTPRC